MKTVKITGQILYCTMKRLMFIFFIFAVLTGCNGLRMGVGLKGVILDDYKLTLDGDTFDIRGRIGDSLLIVLNSNQDDKTPYYLLKYERNGFYYPQIGASDISTIDHTNNYVSIDDEEVYDIKNKKVLFSPPCGTLGLYYLGNWKDLQVFVNSDKWNGDSDYRSTDQGNLLC